MSNQMTMRDRVISNINDIKNHPQNNGFDKQLMRWKNVKFETFDKNNDIVWLHVSDIDMNDLHDFELLLFYETVLRQHCKMM